jgi:L-alanine-DL-glutamate epimerase-like enolase superfamily enzyme
VALGREVLQRGFRALKTNIVIPGEPARMYAPGFDRSPSGSDGVATTEVLEQIESLIGAFSQGLAGKGQIALDLNYNFRPTSVIEIGRLLQSFNMQWVECDTWDPRALLHIKQTIPQALASLESLVSTRQYRPFLELQTVDTAIIDVPWNGFGQAHIIGQIADAYELTVAPHNYYSHLADLHAVHLCASLPNIRIMEIDIDDVPWKKDLVTAPPRIEEGHMVVPRSPGWGADIVEDVLAAHPLRS